MNTTSNEKSYFDLHTSGIGYIQRAREVPVRGGRRAQPFLACTIAALVGPARDPSYRYFDVKVSGAEAKKLVQRYVGVDDPKQRPLVRFRLGDLWGDAYIRNKGENQGKAAASLKARLLKAELIERAELASIEQHELITRGIGYLNRPKDVPPKDGVRSCRAPSPHWPDLSMNRNIDTSTRSSPPLKPSIWFADACRPSKGIARC